MGNLAHAEQQQKEGRVMPSAYPKHLARVRAYNKTEHGRAVKRAARRREYARIKAAREAKPNPAPLAQALALWSK